MNTPPIMAITQAAGAKFRSVTKTTDRHGKTCWRVATPIYGTDWETRVTVAAAIENSGPFEVHQHTDDAVDNGLWVYERTDETP
jgi:hypothetical protein